MSDSITSSVLWFNFYCNLPCEIRRKLKVVYWNACISKQCVYEWVKRFKEGRESVENDPREWTSTTTSIVENVNHLLALITSDHCVNICTLSHEWNITTETIRQMLDDNLNMRKICAKMVPEVLTQEQKQMRKSIWEDLLSRIQSDNRDWMNRVVTKDETWVWSWDL